MATSNEEVQTMLSEFRQDQFELRKHIVSILWHMRGGLSREEAWRLSPDERTDINRFIEERMKIVERTKLPLI